MIDMFYVSLVSLAFSLVFSRKIASGLKQDI